MVPESGFLEENQTDGEENQTDGCSQFISMQGMN